MRFFTMEQDRTLWDMIQFRDFDIAGPRHIFYKEDVSDTVKKVLDMYEDDMVFRTIVITSKESEMLKVYHHLLLERLDMFSEQTEFYPNGSIKRLVLDAKKIGEHKVFMLNDKRFNNPYVSLEVVESLLRRGVVGIIWKEVEVEGWPN